MRNILSLKRFTPIKGIEIKEWVDYQILNNTSHYKEAMKLVKYLNIDNDTLYIVELSHSGVGCGEIIHTPTIVRVK